MLCERCGARRAEVHLVKVVDGERHVQHLCRECAGEYLTEQRFKLQKYRRGLPAGPEADAVDALLQQMEDLLCP